MDQLQKQFTYFKHKNGKWSLASEFRIMRLVQVQQKHLDRQLRFAFEHLQAGSNFLQDLPRRFSHRRGSKNILIYSADDTFEQGDLTRMFSGKGSCLLNSPQMVRRDSETTETYITNLNVTETQSFPTFTEMPLPSKIQRIVLSPSLLIHFQTDIHSSEIIVGGESVREEVEISKDTTVESEAWRQEQLKPIPQMPSLQDYTEAQLAYLNCSKSLTQVSTIHLYLFQDFAESFKGSLLIQKRPSEGLLKSMVKTMINVPPDSSKFISLKENTQSSIASIGSLKQILPDTQNQITRIMLSVVLILLASCLVQIIF